MIALWVHLPDYAEPLLAMVRTMFNMAEDMLGWKGDNPASGIRMFKEKSRDRFLSPDEMRRFFQ